MPEETKVEGDGGESGSDAFDPQTLSKEAQEHIRVEIQKQSDSKAAAATAAEVGKLKAEQSQSARTAVETAERHELEQLATSGQYEALGTRMAARMTQQNAETAAVGRASDFIERQMKDAFTPTLGAEKVQEIHRKVVAEGGAHAEFAVGLAKAADSETRAEEIKSEVKAALVEAGVKARDEAGGADKGAQGGQGQPPEGFDKTQQDFIDGKITRKAYEEALEAREKAR